MMPARRVPMSERLWRRMERQPNGCWLWTGYKDRHGYGRINIDDGHECFVHRIAYELLVEPIPAGLVIDHLCRNHACINPSHLEPVTIGENVKRGMSPRIVAWRTDICLRGHPLTGDNVKWQGRSRACRACLLNAPSNNPTTHPTTKQETAA